MPFSERDVAATLSIFPHVHNLFQAVSSPVEHKAQRCGEVAAAAGLSPRERDVAVLLAERLSTEEIAELLFISRHTVEKHLEHIYLKLRASGMREARQLLLAENAHERFSYVSRNWASIRERIAP